ncbi:hypothetical protein EGW08_003469 [Elysia chlorotica]|uniref:WAP domain-containing protein n=1 Tax=Elysia chlorotica TaxID=188477 RepID=A0A3S1HYP5_ELYCH|nr:hypothetical protein EGW08_003469 [Elysia chlorotica]
MERVGTQGKYTDFNQESSGVFSSANHRVPVDFVTEHLVKMMSVHILVATFSCKKEGVKFSPGQHVLGWEGLFYTGGVTSQDGDEMALVGSVWAANSWADERDVVEPSYHIPFFPPPMVPFHVEAPPIFGTNYFGSAPPYHFRPTPPVYTPPVYTPPVYTPPVHRPPPPMKDATTLCAAIVCSAPSTCRLVQPCPTCPPKAVCLAPAAVPQNFDQGCQAHGYRQGVMLHHMLAGSGAAGASLNPPTTTSLRCIPWLPSLTRGGCSHGAACVPYTQPGAPAGTGTCCSGRMAAPSPLALPVAPPPASPAPAQNQLPLMNSAAASAPMMHRMDKPGTCPSVNYMTPGRSAPHPPARLGAGMYRVNYMMSTCSGSPCTRDSQCGFHLKCCPSACAWSTCTVPSLPPAPPLYDVLEL